MWLTWLGAGTSVNIVVVAVVLVASLRGLLLGLRLGLSYHLRKGGVGTVRGGLLLLRLLLERLLLLVGLRRPLQRILPGRNGNGCGDSTIRIIPWILPQLLLVLLLLVLRLLVRRLLYLSLSLPLIVRRRWYGSWQGCHVGLGRVGRGSPHTRLVRSVRRLLGVVGHQVLGRTTHRGAVDHLLLVTSWGGRCLLLLLGRNRNWDRGTWMLLMLLWGIPTAAVVRSGRLSGSSTWLCIGNCAADDGIGRSRRTGR